MYVFFTILLIISLILNVIFIWYAYNLVQTCYRASEAASEILIRFDAYKIHLKEIFALELFYGDRNLREVIEHTKDIMNFLKRFDGLYSFTQPELESVLSIDDEEKEILNEETEKQKSS